METRSGSGEWRRAGGKSEPGCCADAAGEGADANELNRLRREHLSRDGGAVAERTKPVTERAVFGCGWPSLVRETGVVIGVLVHHRHGKVVAVVGRVPAAQRARQDEDDRQCDKRRRAESQRTYHRNRAGRWRQALAQGFHGFQRFHGFHGFVLSEYLVRSNLKPQQNDAFGSMEPWNRWSPGYQVGRLSAGKSAQHRVVVRSETLVKTRG